MMGGRKTVLKLAALTAAAAALYTAVSFCADRGEERFYRLEKTEAIEAVSLKNANGALEFWREDGAWMVKRTGEGEPAYSAGKEKMSLLLDSLEGLTLSRILGENNPDYGLEDGQAELEFSTSRGNHYGFIVGNETMTKSHVYVKDSVTGKIGIAGLTAAAQLGGSVDAYRNREIFCVDMEKVKSLTYKKRGEETISLVQKAGSWGMEKPYRAPARNIEIEELLAAMRDWNLCAFADTAVYTESQMGLSGDGVFLTLEDENGAGQILEIGTPKDGLVPVRSGGRDDILLLYADEVDLEVLKADKLLFFAPLKASVDEVERIVLAVEDTRLEFTLDSGTEFFTCNGQVVDAEAFYSFYLSYMGLAAAGGDEEAPPKEAGELACLETVYQDGTSARLTLVPRDSATCYMVVNNSYSGFYMSNEKLITLISKLGRLGNY